MTRIRRSLWKLCVHCVCVCASTINWDWFARFVWMDKGIDSSYGCHGSGCQRLCWLWRFGKKCIQSWSRSWWGEVKTEMTHNNKPSDQVEDSRRRRWTNSDKDEDENWWEMIFYDAFEWKHKASRFESSCVLSSQACRHWHHDCCASDESGGVEIGGRGATERGGESGDADAWTRACAVNAILGANHTFHKLKHVSRFFLVFIHSLRINAQRRHV